MSSTRGAVHVDWILSMGIFLIVVFGILIFFKPGILPAFSSGYLIGLITDNVDERILHGVGKVPISFVTDVDISTVKLIFPSVFPFCSDAAIPGDHFKLGMTSPSSRDSVDFSLGSVQSCNTPVELVIDSVVPSSINTFKLFYSESSYGGHGAPLCDPCMVISSFDVGVAEWSFGWSRDKLDDLFSRLDNDYSAVKEEFKLPLTRNFRICANDLSDCHPNNNPPNDVDIVASTISGIDMNIDGEVEGRIDLIIQAW
ncbi:MAG: hypothetical protein AABW49_03670 [Nanoarchaeota archaeon]